MREIKFRAWDEELKVMEFFGPKFYVDDEYFELNFVPTEQEGETPLFETNNKLILMQYIGLKDKDGIEIYEGDIIEYSLTDNEKKTYKDKVFWFDEFCGFEPFVSYDSQWPIYVDLKTLKVIGNIYENPELIQKED